MKHLVALILISNLLACTANLSSEVRQTEPDSAPKAAVENKPDAADWVFQTGCFAPGSTRNDWGTSRPCLLPPRAVKDKPPALRVVVDSTKPIKSPHGFIITKDYKPGGFGGFIGDCSDDKNWPYYWQCLSENSGNGFK